MTVHSLVDNASDEWTEGGDAIKRITHSAFVREIIKFICSS